MALFIKVLVSGPSSKQQQQQSSSTENSDSRKRQDLDPSLSTSGLRRSSNLKTLRPVCAVLKHDWAHEVDMQIDVDS
ncbi:hypothetical protein Emed_005711 [Eimeria media]